MENLFFYSKSKLVPRKTIPIFDKLSVLKQFQRWIVLDWRLVSKEPNVGFLQTTPLMIYQIKIDEGFGRELLCESLPRSDERSKHIDELKQQQVGRPRSS